MPCWCRLGIPARTMTPKPLCLARRGLWILAAISSSPSNPPAPFERGRFPSVTISDNVRLQHLLVTRHLGIERLRLVTGWAMGACQTYQWAAQYPDMVRTACPISGSARTAGYNQVFLLSLKRALELDPTFAEGFYDHPSVRGLTA